MIRVAVVDDHPHVAIALRALLNKTPDIRLVTEARRGSEVTRRMSGVLFNSARKAMATCG